MPKPDETDELHVDRNLTLAIRLMIGIPVATLIGVIALASIGY